MGNVGASRRFGKAVRVERAFRGMSQAELAEAVSERGVKVYPTTIAKIESQDDSKPRAIKLDEAVTIADILRLDLNSFLQEPAEITIDEAIERISRGLASATEKILSASESITQVSNSPWVDNLQRQLLEMAADGKADARTRELFELTTASARVSLAFTEPLRDLSALANADSPEIRMEVVSRIKAKYPGVNEDEFDQELVSKIKRELSANEE